MDVIYSRDQAERPWDHMLQEHVRLALGHVIQELFRKHFASTTIMDNGNRKWDACKESIAIRERDAFPAVGTPIDPRAFEYGYSN